MPVSFRWVLTLLLAAPLFLTACDSGGDDDDDTPPPSTAPTFAIASAPVTLADGSAGLQFAATASANVVLTEVVITNPVGQTERFNAGGNTFLSGAPIALQADDVGYTRISGNWSFRFIGSTTAPATPTPFTVTTPLSVGARPAPGL